MEQTEIAKKLGISNTQFRRIAECARLEFWLVENKRHYDFAEVLEAIRKAQLEAEWNCLK